MKINPKSKRDVAKPKEKGSPVKCVPEGMEEDNNTTYLGNIVGSNSD
jgi:hypothetical protein